MKESLNLSAFCTHKFFKIIINFVDKGAANTVGTWCNWWGDYLQIDQKTMLNYADPGSPQNRFCGNFNGKSTIHWSPQLKCG